MKDYSKLKTELLEKIAASKKAISASAIDVSHFERAIGDLVLEEFKETHKIDFDSLVTCYEQVYRVTKFEVVDDEVYVYGKLVLPREGYAPTVRLQEFKLTDQEDKIKIDQMEINQCGCRDFASATESGTDSEEFGACFVYYNGEWFTGKTLPAVSFCPWCGKRLKKPESQ